MTSGNVLSFSSAVRAWVAARGVDPDTLNLMGLAHHIVQAVSVLQAAPQYTPPRSATKTVTSLLLTAPVAATLTWDTPFADTTYKATASVVGGTAATTATVRITAKTTTGCTISVTGGLLGGTAIIDALAVP